MFLLETVYKVACHKTSFHSYLEDCYKMFLCNYQLQVYVNKFSVHYSLQFQISLNLNRASFSRQNILNFDYEIVVVQMPHFECIT